MIHIVGRDSIPQMQAFDDVKAALSFDCDVYLGAFAAPFLGLDLVGKVIYNMEYLHDSAPIMQAGYLELLRKNIVIDYSRKNVRWLAAHGIEAHYMPYGYHSNLVRPVAVKKDIDVLFIGSTHHTRRIKVLDRLAQYCRLEVTEGVYGADLDAMRARSNVHINMHHAEGQPLEVVRLNYLLANRCTVVSELGGDDEVNKAYTQGLYFTDYDGLFDACVHALDHPGDGYEIIKAMPQSCGAANHWAKDKLCLQ